METSFSVEGRREPIMEADVERELTPLNDAKEYRRIGVYSSMVRAPSYPQGPVGGCRFDSYCTK